MPTGSSLSDVSRYNQNVVIHAFRRRGPSSQREIAQATGLSVATVSLIVRTLLSRGLLTEIRTEVLPRGRPRVIADLVASSRHAIGLHVDPSLMTAVLLDLKGSVVAEASSRDVDPEDPRSTMGRAAELAREVGGAPSAGEGRIQGTGLAVPGPVDPVRESLVSPVWLPGWSGAPLSAMLREHLDSPIPLIKDTLAAVIGESWTRGGQALDSTMVFLYVGTGTGIGLSNRGEPLGGASGNTGEVGAMLLALDGDEPSPESALRNDPAKLVDQARRAGILTGPTEAVRSPHEVDLQFRALCRLARDGDRGAVDIVSAAAGRIARVAAMAVDLVDADMLVFGGPYWELVSPWYLEAARRQLAQRSAGGPHPVTVSGTVMDGDVGAVGAASAVLDRRFVPRPPGRGLPTSGGGPEEG